MKFYVIHCKSRESENKLQKNLSVNQGVFKATGQKAKSNTGTLNQK